MLTRTATISVSVAAIVVAVAIIVSAVLSAASRALPDCEWETGEGQPACVWHADRQGDGLGDSLLLIGSHTVARW